MMNNLEFRRLFYHVRNEYDDAYSISQLAYRKINKKLLQSIYMMTRFIAHKYIYMYISFCL